MDIHVPGHCWWLDPIAIDIHNNFRRQEDNLPVYYARSPQIESRRYLVDWLAVICDRFDVCPTGRHLAVTLLDYFMDKFEIEPQQLQLVALGCLLVAGKRNKSLNNVENNIVILAC